MSGMIEIRMHGRGGQGAVIASKILADAAFLEGKYVQSFPQFGVERRGAPVAAFVRIAEGEAYFVRSLIYEPDHVIVLDPTLLEAVNVLQGVKKGGWILVNHPGDPKDLQIAADYRVATVDAARIAVAHGLGSPTQPIVNTSILGAFVKVTEIVSLDSLLKAIEKGVPLKKEENVKAAMEAYEAVKFLKEKRGGEGNG
jgi:2-oxoacid:acceptor oxidoreductase gamma subunit (pyruvate/2-ketoisovalerate family)